MPGLLLLAHRNLSDCHPTAEELLNHTSQDLDVPFNAAEAITDLEVPCVLERRAINPHGSLSLGLGLTSRAILPDPS